jgi:dTDP-3,4-didehydro-2,6-dideoxy-alpha-D-glucose 3-reductase
LRSDQRGMRLVVWGLGRHAIEKILPAVAAAGDLELYGVCSRNSTIVADRSAFWSCKGWTRPEEMLKDPQVQIVYVATPIGLHAEHGTAVLAAGKHLWCEKTLTSRLSDTLELLNLSRASGLSVCEGHMYLHHPQFLRLARYLSERVLGRILSVSCRFGIPTLANPGFRSDPDLGGGALLDVGCYPVSAIQALFPGATQTVVLANIASRDGANVDTDGHAVIQVSDMGLATLEWKTNSAYRNEIDVWGESASLFTEKIFSKPATYAPMFRVRDGKGNESLEYVAAADHFVLMLEAFREILGDAKAMESERMTIARRAEVLEQIRSRSAQPVSELSTRP